MTTVASDAAGRYEYFHSDRDVSVAGYGATVEEAFQNAAEAMFALAVELAHVQAERTLPVSFIEESESRALARWLDLLADAAARHHLVFREFHLQREGALWWGCATGQRVQGARERELPVKRAERGVVLVRRIPSGWEARCSVEGPALASRAEARDHRATAS